MEGATPEALEQLRRIEAIADPYAMQPQTIMEEPGIAPGTVR